MIKDRLVSVNGVAISYDSSNPLNPTKYGSKWFTFEGRRLTRLTLTSGYYEYKYNDQGLRIQKKDYRGITWDYTYDGDKLIYESSPYGKLNFLYDENNMLYGFIKDNTEKYLYIRDNLQNIIAITTLSGEIVVKNTYDAWGKLLSTTGSIASTIGAIAGLGAGLGTTALSSGLGDVVGGVFDGSIKSFSDGCIAFASGDVLGAIGYGISNGISKGLARRKLNRIVPNWNAKNGKINKQLANAGYKNLKIGRDGYNKIFDTVYKDSGYDILNKGISYAYDFITSLF